MTRYYFLVFVFWLCAVSISDAQWTALNGPPGGTGIDIEIDAANSKVYSVVNNEKLFVSANDGGLWTEIPISTNINPYDLLLDAGAMYLLTTNSLFKSEDAGANWVRVSANNQFTSVQKMIKHPSDDTYFVYGSGGLFVTIDGGVNWTKINDRNTSSAVVTATGDVFFTDNQGISKHAMPPGAADSWDKANNTLVYARTNITIRLAVSGSSIFATISDDVLKSDNGTDWPSVKTATITETSFSTATWATASNGVYLIVNSFLKVYFTSNGGTTWSVKSFPTTSYSGLSVNDLKFASATKAFAATASDGIFKTTDAAATWALSTNGIHLQTGTSIEITSSGRIVWARANGRGFWYSDDGGATWNYYNLAVTIQRLRRLPNNTLLGLGSSQLFYSTNNGTSWTQKVDGTILQDVTNNSTFSATTYYGVGPTRVAKSTDGITWTNLTIAGLPTSYSATKIAQDDSGRLYVYLSNTSIPLISKNEIYRIDGITAAGTTGTATLLTVPPGEEDAQTAFFANHLFVSNNKVYLGTFYHVHISSDQGANWSMVNFSKYSLFPIKKGSDYAICAGTDGSLYVSQDDGKSWTRTSMPSTNSLSYITELAVSSTGDYYAAGYYTPVLKYTDELILPSASLPPFIDFNWQPTNGPYGGSPLKGFSDNSNNSYALSSGAIYKTGPAFASWVDKSSGNTFNEMEIDKANNKIFAVTNSQLLTSVNGGDSWEVLNSENIQARRFLRRCPNGDLVFSGIGTSIYVSTDGGVTFGTPKLVHSPKNIVDIVVTSSSAIIVHLRTTASPATYEAVISTDRGVTWNPMSLNGSPEEFSRISADQNGNIYSTVAPISKSSNNGGTWTSIVGNLPSESIASKVFVSASNALYITAAIEDVMSLYKSTDAGANWTKQGDLPGLASTSSIWWIGTRMILATSLGILISDDDGATFTLKSANIPTTFYSDIELLNPSKLLVSAGGGLGFISTDFQEWTQPNNKSLRYFFRKPDGTLLGQNTYHLFSTPDEGTTWTKISDFPEPMNKVVTPNGVNYYGFTIDKVYVSTNLTSWTEIAITGMPEDFQYRDLAVDSNGFIYAVAFNIPALLDEFYQIVFGAASKLNAFPAPRVLNYQDGKVYLYESTGAISSTGDGSEWTTKSAPIGIGFIITSNNYYFIPQTGGSLWLSRDEGGTWQNVGSNSFNSNVYFQNIVVNEYNGYAYATLLNSVVRKSANVIIPPETNNPVVTALNPADGATDVNAHTAVSITFNEVTNPVAGKKIRIYDADNELTPIEIIDATAGTRDGKTFSFTPSAPLTYEKTFFIIVDAGAFTDIFGNPSAGITNIQSWRFTVEVQPDESKPVISYSPVAPAFTKNSPDNKLQITVTDEGGSLLDDESITLHYRGITSGNDPSQAVMTKGTGNVYEVSVPDAWLDELGLEFVFEARDNEGNIQLSPDDALTNGNFHKGYIAFPASAHPSLPSDVLSFGGKEANYRVFSIPFKLNDAKISTIFEELSGQEVKKEYRILNFNTETGKYTEYPSLSTIARGTGYWINIKNPTSISIENASTPENSKDQLFSLSLKPGWNQIGNPYPFTISWDAVRNAVGNASIGILKTYNGSTFADDDKLNSFEGGFVLLDGTSSVNVTIPFTAKTTSGRTGDHGLDFAGGWMLPLKVENSRFHTMGGVGMHPDANMSFDPFDDAMPPKIFNLPEISFPHSEHFIKRFTRDVVPLQNEYSWNFDLETGEEGSVLKWDIGTAKSLEKDLYLFDEREQKLIDMTEDDHYAVAAEPSTPFRIYYGVRKEDIRPSRIILGKPYPNPSTNTSSITFTLPENKSGTYAVSLNVYDMLGRKVTTLAQGQFPSGFYAAEWRPEPVGINASLYMYRLTVSDNKSNITLTEKIIIQK